MTTTAGVATGALLLADISGYTGFLDAVTTAHHDDLFGGGAVPAAYPLISTLLDGIIERIGPAFRLAKLEGDAVFAYSAGEDSLPRGAAVLDCMARCYAGFKAQLGTARELWSCQCDACVRVADLDLKFVLHAGSFIVQAPAPTSWWSIGCSRTASPRRSVPVPTRSRPRARWSAWACPPMARPRSRSCSTAVGRSR